MNILTEDLTALQIFSGLGPDAASQICASLRTLEFSADDLILNEGESVQALWIILEGQCVVSRSCDVSSQRILAELNPGDVFGEMSFVRRAPHSASIRAVGDVKVCSYRRSEFLELLRADPEAAWRVTSNIADVLAERLRRMDTWVCEIMDRPDSEDHRNEWETFRSAVYTNWNF